MQNCGKNKHIGKYIGNMFFRRRCRIPRQVCYDMRRNPDEISCRMKLNSDVPNQGLG